jgi:uncharacterized protein
MLIAMENVIVIAVVIVPVKKMNNSVPHLYSDTYLDKIDSFVMVHNPLSEKGLSVLNREAVFLFNQIDNKKTLNDILIIAQKENPQTEFKDIKKIFQNFEKFEIIWFDKPKDEKQMFNKPIKNLGVWLHITNQCNLRCKYCYVWKTNEKMSEETGELAISNIIRDAAFHKIEKITFKFSGGECLLELELVRKLIKFGRVLAKKSNIQAKFVVLTNGVLLTEKIVKILKNENVHVALSLDGLGKFNDNRVFPSGKSSFEFVEKGINNLIKFKVPFNVSITVTSFNVENLPALTKWLLDKNIVFTFNFYRENPFVSEKLEGNDAKLVKSLKESYKIIEENLPNRSMLSGLIDRVNLKNPHLHTCGMGRSYIIVRHNGTLHSCQMTLEKPIGNIQNKDLIEAMRVGNFIRPKSLQKVGVEGKSPCKTCQWRYVCSGGCPLLTYSQKGKYNINSPYCEVYKSLIPEVLHLEAKRLIKYGLKEESEVRRND